MMFFMFNVYGLFSLIRKKLVDIFLNLLVAVTNIYIMAMAMTFFFRQFDYSRVVLVYSAVFSFVLLAIWQYIYHQWEWKHFPKQTAVLFAAGEEAARIQNKLAKTYDLEQALQSVCDGCQQSNWQQQAYRRQLLCFYWRGAADSGQRKNTALCTQHEETDLFLCRPCMNWPVRIQAF